MSSKSTNWWCLISQEKRLPRVGACPHDTSHKWTVSSMERADRASGEWGMPNSRDQLHMLPCESQNRRMPASRQSREIVETGEKYQTKVLVRTKDQSPAIHRENSFKSSTQVSLDLKVKWEGRRMRWSQSSNSVSLWPQLPLPLTLTYKTDAS